MIDLPVADDVGNSTFHRGPFKTSFFEMDAIPLPGRARRAELCRVAIASQHWHGIAQAFVVAQPYRNAGVFFFVVLTA